jgi:N-acylneuraminate cytidylyltransferase
LQPTSPFRTYDDVAGAISLYTDSIDMVASVKPASCNPYYDGYEDDAEELLTISKGDGTIERRQDAPRVWQLNGAVYVINPESLKNKGLSGFTRIRKYVMDELHSLDLDTMFDWKVAELILKENLIKI